MTIRLGYACINMHLQKNFKVTTNRGMIKRTFKAKGINYASELAEHNTRNILPILKWNRQNNIEVFRMSSCLLPWGSEYEIIYAYLFILDLLTSLLVLNLALLIVLLLT